MTKSDLNLLDQDVLLAVIRGHPDAYGVTIQECIEQAGRNPSLGAIYASLDRLQDRKLITARIGDPTSERGGRRKVHFTITAAGRSALHRSLRTTQDLQAGVDWSGVRA